MNKHSIFLFALIGIFLFTVIPVVSAQEVIDSIVSGVQTAYDRGIAPLASFLLKEPDISGELFFSKLLLFILVISVVYLALRTMPLMSSNPRTLISISFIVAVLSIRYITSAWVETILLPYTTLAVSITTILPWIIFAVFVEKACTTGVMRRVAWIFAGGVYLGMYFYRFNAPAISGSGTTFRWIYLVVILGCIGMFAFDGTIHTAFRRVKHANNEERRRNSIRFHLSSEYNDVRYKYDRSISQGNPDKPGANSIIDGIRSRAIAAGIDQDLFKLIP